MQAIDTTAPDPQDAIIDDYPEPECGNCEDYGYVEISDPSTDGLIGSRPCEVPACVERRRVARERHEAQKAAADRAAAERAAAHAAVCTGWDCCPPF